MKVKAKVKVLSHQLEFTKCTAQYPALVGGYGCGKTEAGIFRFMKFMTKYGPIFKEDRQVYTFGIYEPDYSLFTLILYPRFEQIFSSLNVDYVLNKSDKTLLIPAFNTKVIFRSMESEEKIVGYEHADFWIDELDTLKKDKAKSVFEKIVARNRLNKPDGSFNTGSVTTTPEGFKFVYDTWERAKDKDKFKIIKGRTENNVFLPETYVEDLRSQYPANLIDAYLNGEFVNLTSSSVYPVFDRINSSTDATIEDVEDRSENGRFNVHIGMDFNVGHMSAVIALHNYEDHEILIVDEISELLDTPTMIEEILSRYPLSKYNHFLYPDAAGGQRKSVGASQSDISLLKGAKFYIRSPKKNPLIKDRVMSVNGLFLNSKNERRLFVNVANCPTVVSNLEQQAYDPKTGQPDKTQGNDHMLDALGYLVHRLYPIKKQTLL